MPDRPHFESLFLEHLPWIRRVASIVCTRYSMPAADAEDFASWIVLKLMEDEYAVLQRFRGDSTIRTYLANVVTRQFQEYRRERWGRWRPSAAAERLGPLAKDLEALVYRDGYRLDQAGEKLRTNGRTELSDAQLGRLLAQLPERTPTRPTEVSAESALDKLEGSSHADAGVTGAETNALRDRVTAALVRVMGRLEPEDRLIARMHFGDGRSLADVARGLRLEQKPLYRRVARLKQRLRTELEADGVRDTDVRGIVGEEDGQ